MSHLRALSLLVLAVIACGRPDDAAEPSGEANVSTDGGAYRVAGTAPRASGGFPSVVQLLPVSEPKTGSESESESRSGAERAPEPEPVLMDQYGNEFHPPVLIVKTGGRVSFKNSEDVLHNVRVVNRETHETIFNVGTPVVGSYVHRFETPGVYDVSCQIHPSMAAFLVVAEASHAVVAEGGGEFSIEGVPAGSYLLKVWNLDASRQSERRVTIKSDVTLDLTREEGGAE